MSARERLWHLYQHPGSPLDFEDALDAYAHELAEQIRQDARTYYPTNADGMYDMAVENCREGQFRGASLIDPKVK